MNVLDQRNSTQMLLKSLWEESVKAFTLSRCSAAAWLYNPTDF